MNERWIALSREAALASEHLGIGATALGRANYQHIAYYSQAFFALSVGLERSCKLALILDHAVRAEGAFPRNKEIRNFGHNVAELTQEADRIAERIAGDGQWARLPDEPIHDAIVDVLSSFASNVTRYYNVDLLTDSLRKGAIDPVKDWYERVMVPTLQRYDRKAWKKRREDRAATVAAMVGGFSATRAVREDGKRFANVYEASLATGETDFVVPYVRMHVLQFARFFAELFRSIQYAAPDQGIEDIPFVAEHYAMFLNKDPFLRRRKSWSIYRL